MMTSKIILLILALSYPPLPGQDINPVLLQTEAPSMPECLEVAKGVPGKVIGNLQILGASCIEIKSDERLI